MPDLYSNAGRFSEENFTNGVHVLINHRVNSQESVFGPPFQP